MRIPVPTGGLAAGIPAQDQAVGTFFSGQNIRAFDTTDGRLRVGQRAGTVLAYTTRIVGDFPVIALVEVVTTYITPE